MSVESVMETMSASESSESGSSAPSPKNIRSIEDVFNTDFDYSDPYAEKPSNNPEDHQAMEKEKSKLVENKLDKGIKKDNPEDKQIKEETKEDIDT